MQVLPPASVLSEPMKDAKRSLLLSDISTPSTRYIDLPREVAVRRSAAFAGLRGLAYSL
jgi:hypothetical protein